MICWKASVLASRSGMMNGTLVESLPSASRISGNGAFSLSVKVLSSTAVHLVDRLQQLLAERVALAPALDRGDAVGGAHRLAVMPFEAVAQRETVGQLVVAGRPLVDHLRLRLEVLVEREQRVEDQIAEIARDIGGGPDRVEDAQIGLRDEPQASSRRARAPAPSREPAPIPRQAICSCVIPGIRPRSAFARTLAIRGNAHNGDRLRKASCRARGGGAASLHRANGRRDRTRTRCGPRPLPSPPARKLVESQSKARARKTPNGD